ncbi:uncharacterized protein LOC130137713 [Syzygium oleosum]|uniref:uncharacterized protein LOC130137713 n=1 Tax=Syzygium oleosum TaxID=219896 RepID=UPI0024BB8654|nr:uncharacterized protein LOC130137713 [Syzygium oleosum]
MTEGEREYTVAQFRKAKPPTYDGKSDPLLAERWIRRMERIFRTDRVPNDRKVDFATQCLEGEVEYWWEGTRLALGGRDATISWEDFTKAFNTQFFPRSFQAKMRDDFIHISWGDSIVMDYAGRFNQLSRFAKHYVDDEELKAEHFQRGLRLNIRSKLAHLELTTYKDVLERAIKVEWYKLERDTQEEDAAASNTVVAGNISIALQCAYALFDSGATHSFVSTEFVKKLDVLPEPLEYELRVNTPTGDFLVADHVFKGCVLQINNVEMTVDLVELNVRDFNIIIGIDWLSTYRATVDCFSKKVIFRLPCQPEFSFSGSCKDTFPRLISALQAKKLLRKGCSGYLACVKDTSKVVAKLEDVPVVREFPNVFPENLPGLPLDREIEFCIELMPGTAPISKAPYRMAPTELKELKTQLKELLDKGFIRPSVSSFQFYL